MTTSALPMVRGKIRHNVPLAPSVWFRVGGAADTVFRPADTEDLQNFMKQYPKDAPLQCIGVGSNLLIRDKGVEGVLVRLGAPFASICVDQISLRVGAAALDRQVADTAAYHGIAGLSFLVGIPGTIGGALKMNAGAYGREIKDVLVSATFIDRDGRSLTKTVDELEFTYRSSNIPNDWIAIEAVLKGEAGNPDDILKEMELIMQARASSQPVRARTGGSTFKNPLNTKAWELIHAAGCRGLTKGGAQVSPLHCNFLINTGTATAADLEGLGEEVRQRVFDASGIMLEWEIKRIGRS